MLQTNVTLDEVAGLHGVGRLKDSVSVRTTLANIRSIARQLENQYPDLIAIRGRMSCLFPNTLL